MSTISSRRHDEDVPVLIVGGSVVGLSMALFLAQHGIAALLVERHTTTSIHARAGSFNARTLEFFRQVGIESAIFEQETPPEHLGEMGLRVESLMGKVLDTTEATAHQWANAINPFASPTRSAIIGQDKLEPILQKHARELGSDIRFGTELVHFEHHSRGIDALIREQATGEEYRIHAHYLVAADGNRSALRQQLGIGSYGYGALGQWVSILFQTDLSKALQGRKVTLCFVNNATVDGILGQSGASRDRWALFANLKPRRGERLDAPSEAYCLDLVRAAIGIPDQPVKIVSTLPWELASRVAERYQQERVFLVGDAAHVMTTMGAFGANTGIADAHNLAWKMALVLKKKAHESLLATYNQERQPAETWEIFIAASGARKGFMDRSLNTAQSGYLTRKLVEVGMEVWTTMADCGTKDGWLITNAESQALGFPDMRSRIVGRVLAEPGGHLQVGVLLDTQHVDELLATGITAIRVRSPFTCQAEYGICCHCYGQDLATGKLVKRGVAVGVIAGQSIGEPGTQLTMRTFHSGGIANAQGDITQGLPRVSELFEARIPKGVALLAEIEGEIQIEKRVDTGKTVIRIVGNDASALTTDQSKEYEMVPGQSLLVENGQTVAIGMPLTTGARNPRQILDLQGREETARYLINEVQRVYRATGVYISDKHVEVIVRQMLRSVQVSEPGDTALLPGDLIDGFGFTDANASIMAQGGEPAQAYPVLLGLTRTALNTASWVAAASFQETSKVLTQAAIRRQVDSLRGFKERVVLGARIPRIFA